VTTNLGHKGFIIYSLLYEIRETVSFMHDKYNQVPSRRSKGHFDIVALIDIRKE